MLLALLSLTAAAEALDQARQNQMDDLATYYRNALRGEEVVELSASGESFLGLWLEQRTGTPQGGILLLHDQGHQADWPFRLQQARSYLPDVGWNTLSITLPRTPDDLSDADYDRLTMARVNAGVQRLIQEGQLNLVLLGYGEGAYWAARYMAMTGAPPENFGYALMMVDATPDRADLPDLIGQLEIPVLDLVFNDDNWAKRNARERKAEAARNQLENYLLIEDAPDGTFLGEPNPSRTTRRLWGWLRSNAAGQEVEVKR